MPRRRNAKSKKRVKKKRNGKRAAKEIFKFVTPIAVSLI